MKVTPFDNFQNSALWANTPIHISHITADQAWYYAETAYAGGWVPASDVAFVDDRFETGFRTGSYAAMVADEVPIPGERGLVRFTGKVGMLFPLVGEGEALSVFVAVADDNRRAVLNRALLPRQVARPFPLEPTQDGLARVAEELMALPYGWGGLYGNRDCSAFLRDLFTPFGIWLPRNSSQQARVGEVHDLKKMDSDEREEFLLERGVPWMTLVHLPGHIMLYVGKCGDRAAVLHDIWGLRTEVDGREGRKIIGRPVVTTLEPGRELDELAGPRGILLNRVGSMNILGRAAP